MVVSTLTFSCFLCIWDTIADNLMFFILWFIFCLDYDECAERDNTCNAHAHCVADRARFDYLCQCMEGYQGDGFNCTKGMELNLTLLYFVYSCFLRQNFSPYVINLKLNCKPQVTADLQARSV